MQVVNKDGVVIGHCNVKPGRLQGNFFVVPTINEGEYCQACGYRHTFLSTVSFSVCIGCTEKLALMAQKGEDAKHLPGFKKSNR